MKIPTSIAPCLVDDDLVAESDLIITMTDAHQQALEEAYPEAADKTFPLKALAYGEDGLDGSLDIEDPYRGDAEVMKDARLKSKKR